MGALSLIQEYYIHREHAVRNWKDKGGKVVGYFCSVPEELIIAGGFLPFRISGNPEENTTTADKYVEPLYDPYARSILNMFLTGEYDFIDYMIIPHSRDAIFKLYYHLKNIQSINPHLNLPEMYLFDMCHAKYWSSAIYTHQRLEELKQLIGCWAGIKISDSSIRKAIEVTNENRRLLHKVTTLRTDQPPRMSGVEALQIIGSSMVMVKEEHNILLARLIEESEGFSKKTGARVYVCGSPVDNTRLYEIIESCGLIVTGEDNCWGNRYVDFPVDSNIEPLEALLDKYYYRSLCYQMYPMGSRLDYAMERAIKAEVDGVIFYSPIWDNAWAWEYPEWKRKFEKENIPLLELEVKNYSISEDEEKIIREKVHQFKEQINKG